MQKAHICILSHQTLQNVLPLNSHGADYVFVAVSKEMHEQNRHTTFAQVLVDLNLVKSADRVVTLEPIPSTDFAKMRQWADQQIALIRSITPQGRITLNATGGTKLMSLALIESLKQPSVGDIEIIYCDTFNDTLETIYPMVYQASLQPDILTAEDILKAHGIKQTGAQSDHKAWRDAVQQRAALTMHLGTNMSGPLAVFVSSLNAELARKIGGENLANTHLPLQLTLGTGVSSDWNYVLTLMSELGLISLQEPLAEHKPARFAVNTLEAVRYLHGVWLEEYLWLCFEQAKISDIASGAEISSLHQDQAFKDNELDLVAGHRNNLVIVECKTANISRQQVLNQALDKLDGISRRSGGLLAERWFATARWPNEKNAEEREQAERFRLQAKERGVVLIEPKHLANLIDRLKEWKKTARFPLN